MANRRRGTFSLPEEFRTTEKLSTKKEMAQRRSLPTCPSVPIKMRKNLIQSGNVCEKPKVVCYNQQAELSAIYNPNLNASYLDQVFDKHVLVGEGSFGRVFRTLNREDGRQYAIKCLKSAISIKDRYAEVRNNEKVGIHPNCVQFFMAWEENYDVYMLLEFCNMSLADFSLMNNDIPEEMLWNVLYDMCKALNFLHKRKLLHLDVKPANIMMKNGLYKLGDFGILVDLKLAPLVCKSTLSDGDSKYLALEVLEGVYQPSCDIFGLGLSLLELAADLELPDNGPLWQQLRHEVLPQNFYDRVSLGFKVIIERMLKPDHKNRPSAESILKYKNIRMLEKRDKKFARIDYFATYLGENQCVKNDFPLQNMPIIINNNNNIIDPPHCIIQENRFRNRETSNTKQFFGRKALFRSSSPRRFKHPIKVLEMNNLFNTSVDRTLNSLASDDENASPTGSYDGSNSSELFHLEWEGFCCNNENDDPMSPMDMDNVVASMPIVQCQKMARMMPKTKLTFD